MFVELGAQGADEIKVFGEPKKARSTGHPATSDRPEKRLVSYCILSRFDLQASRFWIVEFLTSTLQGHFHMISIGEYAGLRVI